MSSSSPSCSHLIESWNDVERGKVKLSLMTIASSLVLGMSKGSLRFFPSLFSVFLLPNMSSRRLRPSPFPPKVFPPAVGSCGAGAFTGVFSFSDGLKNFRMSAPGDSFGVFLAAPGDDFGVVFVFLTAGTFSLFSLFFPFFSGSLTLMKFPPQFCSCCGHQRSFLPGARLHVRFTKP